MTREMENLVKAAIRPSQAAAGAARLKMTGERHA
jgi:hypothetical protein